MASDVTPVQKVIQLLDNMKEKGTKEMQEEQVQYAKFKQFCETTLAEKKTSITEASDKMEVLEADIEKATSEARRLGKEIVVHASDIEKDTAEREEAVAVRKKEAADYAVELKDYTESISALTRAIKVLKTNDEKVSDLSLVQLSEVRSLKMLPQDAADSIDAYISDARTAKPRSNSLLEQGTSSGDAQAPQPKAYEFQSGGVIEMMENLLDKFTDKRVELEKEEASKKHAFGLLVQSLEAQIAAAQKEKEEKTEFKAKQEQDKATAEGDLQETTAERDSDQKYHDDLKATFARKADDFDTRQKTRSEELEAIAKAKEIISSGAVAGAADQHLPSLMQIRKTSGSALAFLRADSGAPVQAQVAKFLQEQATLLNSRVLSAAAVRVGADPLAKVRTLIEDLIKKMNDQMAAEATKKGWCDTELATNKATREEKSDAVDSLQADIDELSSTITTLGEELVTLSKEITDLTAAMAEATEIRQKEKQKNAATVKDAKEAQAAVAQALGVLKEFYAKAGEATAFVQTSSKGTQPPPEIFGDEPYTGMGGENGGVVAMMEVIESDFARLEAETSSAEEAAKKEFDEFMEDTKIDKATKKKTVSFKANKKQNKEQEMQVLDGDLQGTHKELDAALQYFDTLKADCLDAGKSYAERKAQREKEIEDLTKALALLNNVQS
eukprot:TRINITY_DN3823_c0_g3_i2.p1 TRINITY_DN3823_c0_g3~~TRINITY_DN3823_c0_g3_i2.p1  ORF type:complete len:712 (+),score=258.65 TRINITY_DN3823_c0_g3_i2:125-2137(+)